MYGEQTERLMRYYRKKLITTTEWAPSMESSHGCSEPYGDTTETSREFSHEGDIV